MSCGFEDADTWLDDVSVFSQSLPDCFQDEDTVKARLSMVKEQNCEADLNDAWEGGDHSSKNPHASKFDDATRYTFIRVAVRPSKPVRPATKRRQSRVDVKEALSRARKVKANCRVPRLTLDDTRKHYIVYLVNATNSLDSQLMQQFIDTFMDRDVVFTDSGEPQEQFVGIEQVREALVLKMEDYVPDLLICVEHCSYVKMSNGVSRLNGSIVASGTMLLMSDSLKKYAASLLDLSTEASFNTDGYTKQLMKTPFLDPNSKSKNKNKSGDVIRWVDSSSPDDSNSGTAKATAAHQGKRKGGCAERQASFSSQAGSALLGHGQCVMPGVSHGVSSTNDESGVVSTTPVRVCGTSKMEIGANSKITSIHFQRTALIVVN